MGRHRAAGRSDLPPGRAAAVRRRRAAVRGADAVRSRALAALRGTPLPTTCPAGVCRPPTLTHCGQLGGLRPRPGGAGLGSATTPTRCSSPPPRPSRTCWRPRRWCSVAEAGFTHIQDMPDKLTGGPNGRGLRFNGPGTIGQRQLRLRGRHCPTSAALPRRIWSSRRTDSPTRRPRVSRRRAGSNTPASWVPGTSCRASLAARRVGHHAGTRRQLRRRPLRPDARRRRQPAGEVGGRRRWTKFGGAGRFNDINDRDFVAATVKFSF